MATFTVIKRNVQGQETWRYDGDVIERSGNRIVLQAFFDRQDVDLNGLVLARGDRFLETYYTDRWYNEFEIHAREDDHLRGWYCNITFPAEISENTLSYIDLALDLLVFPDGRQIVLDEDEFAGLDVDDETRRQARNALADLQRRFKNRTD